jgi:hypothetical protein
VARARCALCHTPAPAIRTSVPSGADAPRKSFWWTGWLPSFPVSAPQLTEGIVNAPSNKVKLAQKTSIPVYPANFRERPRYFAPEALLALLVTVCSPSPHFGSCFPGSDITLISQSALNFSGTISLLAGAGRRETQGGPNGEGTVPCIGTVPSLVSLYRQPQRRAARCWPSDQMRLLPRRFSTRSC